jgi:hypothetical protein
MMVTTDGLWTAWTTRKRTRVAHPAHSPDGDEVALFSMIKWSCFQLSKCKQDGRNGPLFGDQMALFSVDKNIIGRYYQMSLARTSDLYQRLFLFK